MSEHESINASSATTDGAARKADVMPTARDQWAELVVWLERKQHEALKGQLCCLQEPVNVESANVWKERHDAYERVKRKAKQLMKSNNAIPQEGTNPTS
jgi:hypothetical protein